MHRYGTYKSTYKTLKRQHGVRLRSTYTESGVQNITWNKNVKAEDSKKSPHIFTDVHICASPGNPKNPRSIVVTRTEKQNDNRKMLLGKGKIEKNKRRTFFALQSLGPAAQLSPDAV